MNPNLVFDIGLYNGDDTAYYLHLGYDVVGIEANPVFAANCLRRFEAEICSGRVTVVNAGILREPGEFTLYKGTRDLNTFVPEVCKPEELEEEKVQCMTAAQLLAQYGQPYFMKVDIEGADYQVLETLTPTNAPAYISLELNLKDPFLDRLIALGYDSFKFVDGEKYYCWPPIFQHEIGWRLLRKLQVIVPGSRTVMMKLPRRLTPKSEWNPEVKYSPDGYQFGWCSGPFGENAYGPWLPPGKALRWFDRLKSGYLSSGPNPTLWWDVHARHSSVQHART